MKCSLTHIYTDKNKGDAAIIVSTIKLIKSVYKDAEINLFSTFGENDRQFKREHEFVKQYANNIYPGLFYQPIPSINGIELSRVFSLLWIFFKFTLLLITKNITLLSLFFSKKEIEGIKTFMSSEIIISKGGSYITTQNKSLRQTISLISMLYPFFLSKRYKKKIIIFSQSIGPITGAFNNFLTKIALRDIDGIYLRESLCYDDYKIVKEIAKNNKIKFVPDAAFALNYDNSSSYDNLPVFSSERYNIGFTLVDHAFKYISNNHQKEIKRSKYRTAIIELMEHILVDEKAIIHIFPQVTSDNSHEGHNDIKFSIEIQKELSSEYKDRVKFYEKDFNPFELKKMYSKMDLFIGTRLHSTIFALSSNVPAINISYHGSKSQGIYNNIKGFKDFVIDINSIDSMKLLNLYEAMKSKKETLKSLLEVENLKFEGELRSSMSEAINRET